MSEFFEKYLRTIRKFSSNQIIENYEANIPKLLRQSKQKKSVSNTRKHSSQIRTQNKKVIEMIL